jgi:predicted transcriptional regulator
MEDEIMGKILFAIKNGAKFYTEIERESGVSPTTLSKYLREMEREGLIHCELDKRKKRVYYMLNSNRMTEIDRLIQAYVNKEVEVIEKKLARILKLPTFTEKDLQQINKALSLIKKKVEEFKKH